MLRVSDDEEASLSSNEEAAESSSEEEASSVSSLGLGDKESSEEDAP
jgi:hypothetical protein